METNWAIITIVLIMGIALIILLVLKDQKEKRNLVKSINDESESKTELDRDSEMKME